MSDNISQGSWEIISRCAASSFADGVTGYFWADGLTWSGPPGAAFLWFVPNYDMLLTDVAVYMENGAFSSREPSQLSIEERAGYPSTSLYPVFIKKMAITRNFCFTLLQLAPMGFTQRFSGLSIPMVNGRYYCIRIDVPTMAVNPAGAVMQFVLKGVYDTPIIHL